MSSNETQEVLCELAAATFTLKPINVVLAATFLAYAVYKMLFHPSGLVGGLSDALEGLVWLMVGFVGLVDEFCMAVYRSLTALA